MTARCASVLLALLAGAALAQAGAQTGVPDHRWQAMKVEPVQWRASVRMPKAMVAPVDLQMTVIVEVLCYPIANGFELRLHYNDFDLGGERSILPELPVRIDSNAPVRLVWSGRGDWLSGPLPASFVEQMREGGFIVVEWGVYVPRRRGDPLRLHLRGSRAALDALPALCR
jgi:hypothetical protein